MNQVTGKLSKTMQCFRARADRTAIYVTVGSRKKEQIMTEEFLAGVPLCLIQTGNAAGAVGL